MQPLKRSLHQLNQAHMNARKRTRAHIHIRTHTHTLSHSLTHSITYLEDYYVREMKLWCIGSIRRWGKFGTKSGNKNAFFYGKQNSNNQLGTECFMPKGIILTSRVVHFVSDRLSYLTLWDCWYDTLFPHAYYQ